MTCERQRGQHSSPHQSRHWSRAVTSATPINRSPHFSRRSFSNAPKHCERCTRLVREYSPVQLREGASFPLVAVHHHRSRASAQAGFISPLCPGQHWRLRPFPPPRGSLRISFVKKPRRGSTGWRLSLSFARTLHDSITPFFFGAEATADRQRTFNPLG